jgi:enterochelin esterase family protein
MGAVAGYTLAPAPVRAQVVAPHSARIDAIQADPANAPALWDDARVPLVEYGATPDAPVTVTFLWRGTAQTEVELSWPVWTPDRRENLLKHIGGTDMWYKTVSLPPKTRLSYQLAIDPVRGAPGDREAYRRGLRAALAPDPLNPNRAGEMSVLELAGAPPQPYVARRADVTEGSLTHEAILLNGQAYDVTFYRPAGIATDRKTPLIVLFDAERYLDAIPTPVILDNMIADRVIPPVSAVLIRNATDTSRGTDLACNDTFADALAGQLMPVVRQTLAVSDAPADTILAGSSFGGLMAACTALRHSETFGAVLSQSGSFWWNPESEPSTSIDTHHLIRWVRDHPRQPVRFYIDAGVLEQRAGDETGSIFLTSQALSQTLHDKDYTTSFHPVAGGHDDVVWRGTLSDGLIELLGGRP